MTRPHWWMASCAVAAFLGAAALPAEDTVSTGKKRRLRPVTIEEYYQQAAPDEQYLFMVEARKGLYRLPVKGERYVFVDWNELYFSSGPSGRKLRNVLSSSSDFDSARFHQLCVWRKRDFYRVEIFNEGFMLVSPRSRAYIIVIPIPKAMAQQLQQPF